MVLMEIENGKILWVLVHVWGHKDDATEVPLDKKDIDATQAGVVAKVMEAIEEESDEIERNSIAAAAERALIGKGMEQKKAVELCERLRMEAKSKVGRVQEALLGDEEVCAYLKPEEIETLDMYHQGEIVYTFKKDEATPEEALAAGEPKPAMGRPVAVPDGELKARIAAAYEKGVPESMRRLCEDVGYHNQDFTRIRRLLGEMGLQDPSMFRRGGPKVEAVLVEKGAEEELAKARATIHEIYKAGIPRSYKEVLEALGWSIGPSAYKRLKVLIEEEGLTPPGVHIAQKPHPCECRPGCPATVMGADKKFARGHSPHNRTSVPVLTAAVRARYGTKGPPAFIEDLMEELRIVPDERYYARLEEIIEQEGHPVPPRRGSGEATKEEAPSPRPTPPEAPAQPPTVPAGNDGQLVLTDQEKGLIISLFRDHKDGKPDSDCTPHERIALRELQHKKMVRMDVPADPRDFNRAWTLDEKGAKTYNQLMKGGSRPA